MEKLWRTSPSSMDICTVYGKLALHLSKLAPLFAPFPVKQG
jgi:hypothetical protein